MLNWDDIRAIDAIADPLGVLSVYADRPDNGNGRLVRAVSLAGELRRLEADMARRPTPRHDFTAGACAGCARRSSACWKAARRGGHCLLRCRATRSSR